MTQVLPHVDPQHAEARPEASADAASPLVVPYAASEERDPVGGAFAATGLICSLLFFALVVFAGMVHPRIEWPLLGLIIATSLAAVVLGSVGGQLATKAGRKAPGLARAAVWLGGGELALLIAFGVMIPSMCRAREPANRAKCGNNLRQIGLALQMYANKNGGRFPDTLTVLLDSEGEEAVTSDVLVCPSTGDERATGQTPAEIARKVTAEPGHLSYVYVGAGLASKDATADRIIAYDNPHNHNDEGINFLYGDAHVEFLGRKQAEQAIARLRAADSAPATRSADASH